MYIPINFTTCQSDKFRLYQRIKYHLATSIGYGKTWCLRTHENTPPSKIKVLFIIKNLMTIPQQQKQQKKTKREPLESHVFLQYHYIFIIEKTSPFHKTAIKTATPNGKQNRKISIRVKRNTNKFFCGNLVVQLGHSFMRNRLVRPMEKSAMWSSQTHIFGVFSQANTHIRLLANRIEKIFYENRNSL